MKDVFPRSRLLQANRCSHLVSSSLSCPCSFSDQSSGPLRFHSSRIQSFQKPPAGPPEVSIGRVTGGTWLAGVTFLTLAGTIMGWTPRFLRQISRTPGTTSHMWWLAQKRQAVGRPGLALWVHGPTYSALRYLAVNIYSPKQRNGDPPCGMDVPLDIAQAELPIHSGVRGCWRVCPLPEVPILLRGSWSDLNMTTLKLACQQVVVALASPPFMIIPIALSIILDSTMTGTFLA